MQITSGKYARKKLLSPKGSNVRPPLSRLRIALFDSLMPFLARGHFLDLFGGTGSFSFEAISRGATGATIVEMDSKTLQEIKKNVQHIQVKEPVTLLLGDTLKLLPQIARGEQTFAVVCIAPPYYKELENQTLAILDPLVPQVLQEDGIVIVQYPTKEIVKTEWQNLELWKQKKYGNTSFDFYLRREED